MRALAVRVRDPSVALPTALTAPHLGQVRSLPSPSSVPLCREASACALPESMASGVVQPHPATSQNSIPMAAQAKTNLHEPTETETDLAAQIARAIHRRPLMNRLAQVKPAYAGELHQNGSTHLGNPGPAPVHSPPTMPSQPVAAASSPVQATYSKPIEGIQPQQERTSPPQTADWLGKAQRERNRARMTNAFAWLSTVAIGGAIIVIVVTRV